VSQFPEHQLISVMFVLFSGLACWSEISSSIV